jgi:hypothetical protein
MSIVKNTPNFLKHSDLPFTTLINKTIESIKDPATLGIYVYLSSKPNDWEISEKNLQNRFDKCRDFIRSRLSELKALGLLKSISIRDENHKIVRWETILYNEAQCVEIDARKPNEHATLLESQDTGKARYLVEPPITNKRYKQIKDNNKTPIVPKGTSERFEEFWNLYPKKSGKKICLDKWKKRNLDSIADKIIAKLTQQVANDDSWARGYIPNPFTYINQDRWEDEISQAPTHLPTKKVVAGDAFSRGMAMFNSVKTYDERGVTYDALHG